MTLLLNSSGPISLPLGTPACGSESWVGGYSPGWRGCAARTGPAKKASARPIIQILIFLPLPLYAVQPSCDQLCFIRPPTTTPGSASGHCHCIGPLKQCRGNVPRRLRPDMNGQEPRIRKSLISNREIFVCDNVIDAMMVKQVGTLVRTLHYVRKEKSRPGVPGLAAVSDIPVE